MSNPHTRHIKPQKSPPGGMGILLCDICKQPAKTHPPYQPCPQWDDRHMLGVRKTGMSKGIRH